MSDKNSLGCEDQRKLHAEVNQILNQRFLLTTAAITVFGAFSSWMIPKDPSQNAAVLAKFVFAGAAFLHLFLLLLFLWNRFLANLQSNIAIYLVLKNASTWQADWKKFHAKRGVLSTGLIQSCVFISLGVLTLLWPFVISMACNLPLEAGWVLLEVVVAVIYFFLVYGFGIRQWLRRDEQTEKRWRKVLGLSTADDTKWGRSSSAAAAIEPSAIDPPSSISFG